MSNVKLSPEKAASVLRAAKTLMALHSQGALGGEVMPEDANPGLPMDSEQNYLYFTLPMALNYQRNSYKLWEAAQQTHADQETTMVFSPHAVVDMSIDMLREKLLKYKVALQPNRHPQIWQQLCRTFMKNFDGSVKRFLVDNNHSIAQIKSYMNSNKKMFPYLSGVKIANYWLYVMTQYTSADFADKHNITVAPDTHVIQASVKLGLIKQEDIQNPNIRIIVSELWQAICEGTDLHPIDIHTPLWLWSRGGFAVDV